MLENINSAVVKVLSVSGILFWIIFAVSIVFAVAAFVDRDGDDEGPKT